MEEYMFREFLDECREVTEKTSYLEIFNYSDELYNSCEEHSLTLDEFENFLHRRGAFTPPEKLKPGVRLVSGLRLIVQNNARHPDTFSPKTISLPRDKYDAMVRAFRLPRRGIETSAVVGPFFWSWVDELDSRPYMQIIHRKSDVRKKGKTRGWEMLLSHCFRTGVTAGYIKGTPSSDVGAALAHARAAAAQLAHPAVLPVILLARDLGPANDQKQRDARDWLRRLENAVSLRDEVEEREQYPAHGPEGGGGGPVAPIVNGIGGGGIGGGGGGGFLEIDGLSRDLVECHGHVLWKRPQAYLALAEEMEKAMGRFISKWRVIESEQAEGEDKGDEEGRRRREERRTGVERTHRELLARIDFYKVKLHGLEGYIHTTLERLKVQREALYNIMSQREARLNLEIAGEQRRIAHASKRDSTAMKSLSLMGVVFLPGSFLASVFGMSFFNYDGDSSSSNNNDNSSGDKGGGDKATTGVSVELWIYFAVTVPVTLAVVALWVWSDRRREARHRRDEADLERDIDKMEKDIMVHMRKRTMGKAHTWNTSTAPVKP